MQIAYLILAHRYPEQLTRLVRKLNTERTSFYIHLDSKTDNIPDYVNPLGDFKNVYFVHDRAAVNWGAFSIVLATLNGMSQIAGSGKDYDYVTIISGQDYPIKSNQYIFDYYKSNSKREFIHCKAFPSWDLPQGGLDRIQYYYDFDNPSTTYGTPNANIYENLMRARGRIKKPIPGITHYTGSQWWSLTLKCVKYILTAVDDNYDLVNFYKYSKYPDEMFFQTIVMNSPFAENVTNTSLWYTDWSGNKTSSGETISIPHPKTLEWEDYPKLSISDKLFARKFDTNTSKELMDLIDSTVAK